MDVFSLVSVVCCQVGVCTTDWSLIQTDPTECGLETPKGGGLGPIWAVAPEERKKENTEVQMYGVSQTQRFAKMRPSIIRVGYTDISV
jgi:hypothetical protein